MPEQNDNILHYKTLINRMTETVGKLTLEVHMAQIERDVAISELKYYIEQKTSEMDEVNIKESH